jgi:Lrp/AsnC family leucine-responsive transcriptional regulator
MEKRMIDQTDVDILKILQEDSRIAATEIAQRVGMVPSAITERIKRLREKGVIETFEVRLNADTLGLGLTAFVFIMTDEGAGSFESAEKLAELPEVQEIFNVAGEDCYLIKVRVKDTQALSLFLRDKIGGIEAVRSTRTTIALETFKETAALPLDNAVCKEKNG